MKPSTSLERFTFQKDSYLKRRAEEGKTPENDSEVAAQLEFYQKIIVQRQENLKDPQWQHNNLEWDLITSEELVAKVRASQIYAQNLYAALCNNEFIVADGFEILKKNTWSCSWRSAGGIIADMRGEGDYIDWYCSGIKGSDEELIKDAYQRVSVGEGEVTNEVCNDIQNLGWVLKPNWL